MRERRNKTTFYLLKLGLTKHTRYKLRHRVEGVSAATEDNYMSQFIKFLLKKKSTHRQNIERNYFIFNLLIIFFFSNLVDSQFGSVHSHCNVDLPRVRRPCLVLPLMLKFQDQHGKLQEILIMSRRHLCFHPFSETETHQYEKLIIHRITQRVSVLFFFFYETFQTFISIIIMIINVFI